MKIEVSIYGPETEGSYRGQGWISAFLHLEDFAFTLSDDDLDAIETAIAKADQAEPIRPGQNRTIETDSGWLLAIR